MKILFLSYYFLPHVGAATWSTYYVASALSQRGHEIRIVVPNVQHALSIDDKTSSRIMEQKISIGFHKTPFFRIPRNLGPILSPFFLFLEGLKIGRASDVVLCQFHPHHFVFVISLIIGRIFQVPVVARANDVYRDMGVTSSGITNRLIKVFNTFNEHFVKYAASFLVVCSEGKEILVSRLGKEASNCRIGLSHNGFDSSEFNVAPKRRDARKSLGIKSHEKIILFVGRHSGKEYGIQLLLESLPWILREVPNSVLMLVGDKISPHQQDLVNSLGISENVKMYGSQAHEKIVKFIVAADVCVGPLMPTLAIPQKVLEYMACGKPIVAGTKSISKDLNPSFNFVVVPSEIESISKAVVEILKNEDYAESLGLNAKKAANGFGWDKVVCELEDVLVRAVNG